MKIKGIIIKLVPKVFKTLKFYEYGIKIKERITIYESLKDKMLRIKASVKSQYGLESNEYNSIKGIKV